MRSIYAKVLAVVAGSSFATTAFAASCCIAGAACCADMLPCCW